MEKSDQELLENLLPQNPLLKKLVDEHRKLEKKVESIGRYAPYSASAALREQQLKKEKLRGMDHIMTILKDHRENAQT